MHDIEDHDLGLYCSFDEYAQGAIASLERALAGRARQGELDTYLWVPHAQVFDIINRHFEGRAKVWYVCCRDNDECDTHDGHLHWERT